MSLPVIQTDVSLAQNQTNVLLKIESRPPGTYRKKMSIRGNSLLSSVFIKQIDPTATLKVNYFDTTTGNEVDERFDLDSHVLLDGGVISAPVTNRITVPRIHNKPQVEIIVGGTGTVLFGIYITVVDSFVSDIDQALVTDGSTANLAEDKGMPTMCLHTDGTWRAVPCTDNGIKVDGIFSEEGITTPANASVGFAAADTEYSYAFPTNTRMFCLINEGNAVIKASWVSGDSGTNYFTIAPGQSYTSPPKAISSPSTTIYLQASKIVTAAEGLKVVSWS